MIWWENQFLFCSILHLGQEFILFNLNMLQSEISPGTDYQNLHGWMTVAFPSTFFFLLTPKEKTYSCFNIWFNAFFFVISILRSQLHLIMNNEKIQYNCSWFYYFIEIWLYSSKLALFPTDLKSNGIVTIYLYKDTCKMRGFSKMWEENMYLLEILWVYLLGKGNFYMSAWIWALEVWKIFLDVI